MRAIINLVSVCFLLLGGGQYLYANTHNGAVAATHNFDKKQHVRLTNKDSNNSLIEDVELNIDEEYHSGEDLHTADNSRFLAAKLNLLDNWYLDFSQQFLLDEYSKRIKIFNSFSEDSYPIYITQQVLRI